LFITSPSGAVAKYCDEHVCVCVCVCLSVWQDISGTAHAIFTVFSVHVAYGRGSVLPGRVTKSGREFGAVLGVFFPIDNAL